MGKEKEKKRGFKDSARGEDRLAPFPEKENNLQVCYLARAQPLSQFCYTEGARRGHATAKDEIGEKSFHREEKKHPLPGVGQSQKRR